MRTMKKPTVITEAIGRLVTHHRELHEWDILDLSSRLFVEKSTVQKLEKGQGHFTVDRLHELMAIFGPEFTKDALAVFAGKSVTQADRDRQRLSQRRIRLERQIVRIDTELEALGDAVDDELDAALDAALESLGYPVE